MAELLLEIATAEPPDGAGPVRVTVPTDPTPAMTLVGFKDRDERRGGVTASVAVCVPLYVPEIVTEVVVPTACVVAVKVPVVAPAATVMFAGTDTAAVLLLDRFTTAPPVGAAALSATVPVDGVPPRTVVGFKAIEDICGSRLPDHVPLSPLVHPPAAAL